MRPAEGPDACTALGHHRPAPAAARRPPAATRGRPRLLQVLRDKPQLAAFSGFHGTTSPLHRAAGGGRGRRGAAAAHARRVRTQLRLPTPARSVSGRLTVHCCIPCPAAAGHLGVCRAIIEPLRARIRAAEAAAGGPGSARVSAAGAKWRRLLATVLNQRSHKSLTPLMLACEHGHAAVAAYLLREGADPLASDFVHSRTCLHYAAVGGHADCLRLLCSDAAMVPSPEGTRPLRDVIVSDLQVGAAASCLGPAQLAAACEGVVWPQPP